MFYYNMQHSMRQSLIVFLDAILRRSVKLHTLLENFFFIISLIFHILNMYTHIIEIQNVKISLFRKK